MTIDRLPNLNLPDFGNVCDASRPILSFAWQADAAHRAAAHAHERGHVIHPETGSYWVVTPEGTWLVPPGQAIWIPPLVHHEVYSHGPVSARILFVDQSCAHALPRQSGTVLFSPLLDALLRRAVAYGNDYPADGPEVRLARVMLDELAALEVAPLLLPVSTEPRLARLMARLVADPGSALGLKELARETGASERTLARLFARETGMSFIQWKMRLRLIASIERLARGATVTDVAADLGYATTSSFIYMFRKQLGVSPGRYQHPGAEDEPLARANPTAMPSAAATTASGSPPTPCAS